MSAAWMSAFVNGSIISAVFVATLSLLFRLSTDRYWNASTRYATWLAALLVTISMPLIWAPLQPVRTFDRMASATPRPAGGFTTVVPLTGEVIEGNQGTDATTKPAPIGPSAPRRFFPIHVTTDVWAQRIVSAWMIVSILMLLRLLVSYVMLHKRKQSAHSDPRLGDDLAGKWLERCGSSRTVRLTASSEIAGPVAAGPIRPHILIPTRLLEELHTDELEQIGLHEAAHFARHDDWALVFQRICEAVFVFHPIVRWITWQMDIEREVACDDFVVEITGGAHRYAECLTRVIEVTNGIPALPLAAPATTTRSVLERRLDMLLNKNRNGRTRVLKIQFAGLLMALGAMIWIAGSEPQLIVFAASQSTSNPLTVTDVPATKDTPATKTVSRTFHRVELSPVASVAPITPPAVQQAPSTMNFMSYEKEIAMGHELAAQAEAQMTMVSDAAINEYVNGVAQLLIRNSDAKVPYTVKVVKSDAVDPLGLPGGFLYIDTTTILNSDSEAELAAVMAHLMAHINARHGAESYSKGQILNIATVPLVFSQNTPLPLRGSAIPIAFYAFSRRAEEEADFLATQYIFKAGYDPSAWVTFSEKLEARETAKPGTVSTMFATHPMVSDRRDRVRAGVMKILPDREHYVLTTPLFEQIKRRVASLN